jgi:hypothetical protein
MPAKVARKSRARKSRAAKKAWRIPMALPKKSARRHRRHRKGGKKAAASKSRAHKVAAVGSKAQVYKGHAHHTSGGLKKADIKRIKVGSRKGKVVYRYVSAKKHAAGKKLLSKMRASGLGRAARLWRAALKATTGGRIPRKGTSEHRLAKAYFRRLMARGGVKTTPPLAGVMSRTRRSARSAR